MLYNKDWDKPKVKADPFSLESLIAWLEKMPADGTYNWGNCEGRCLIGLYGAAQGLSWEETVWGYSKLVGPDRTVAVELPWTFGAALARAREALASRA